MSADVPNDFISILDKKIRLLQNQLTFDQARLDAALRIREQIRLNSGSGLERKTIDVIAEWRRWERDALAFESRP
jgi:hypothetical protein